MATAYTRGDSIALHLTAPLGSSTAGDVSASLGGALVPVQVPEVAVALTGSVPPIIVEHVGGYPGTGEATIRANESGQLCYTPVGGTEGDPVAITDGESVVIEGAGGAAEYVRVRCDGSTDLASVGFSVVTSPIYGGIIGMDDVDGTTASETYYAGMLRNHGEVPVTFSIGVPSLGTARVSDSAQLGATGAGTIATTTVDGFADWPASGWVFVYNDGAGRMEAAYYTSRTNTVLTISSGTHRGLLGTTASAGASDDVIKPISGLRVALEAPSADGVIQSVASTTTAPTAVTFGLVVDFDFNPTQVTLAPLGNYGVWFRRSTPAGMTVNLAQETRFAITVAPDTEIQVYRYLYRVMGDVSANWYIGEDQMPDFTAAPATTFPPDASYALTPPVSGTKTYWVVLRWVDSYGHESYNTFPHKFTINAAGTLLGAFTSAPYDIDVRETASGYVRVRAKYATGVDPTDADKFRIYVTTTGADPDPGTDTPTEYTMSIGQGTSGARVLDETLGPYDFAADVRVLVCAYNSTLLDESVNRTASQITISTVAPAPPGASSAGTDASGYTSGKQFDEVLTTVDAGTNTYWRTLPGITELWVGSTLVFRAITSGLNQITLHTPAALAFTNGTVSGTGTANPVEVVSATELYLCVAGQRKVKIDLTAMTVTADSFDASGSVQPGDKPIHGPAMCCPDYTAYQIYDALLGRWRSFLCVTSAGVFSARWHAQSKT